MELNWIDFTVLIIFAVFAFWGAFFGLIKGLFNIATWVVAIIGAWVLTTPLTTILIKNIAAIHPLALKVSAAIAIFLSFFIITKIIGATFHKMVKKSPLNTLNRVGGVGIGLIKAILLNILLLIILTLLPVKGNLYNAKQQSLIWNFYYDHIHSKNWESIPKL